MAGSTAIDPALVARFKAALDRLNPDGGRIGLAVSGGPDSMAMLLLAQEAIPGGFEVATVNHGLRPEAKDECALVMAACEARGVPCEELGVEVVPGNVQAKAREARYAALHWWVERRKLAALATAHHADDQAETLLMRLNRGSGVAGLAGVREFNYSYEEGFDEPLIRPLLHFRRAELHDFLVQQNVEFATDPSNMNADFDRVRIRNALKDAPWLDPLALSRSAANLADADEALRHATNGAVRQCVEYVPEGAICHPPADREIAIRVVARVLRTIGNSARGSEVARLVDGLIARRGGTLAGVLATVEADRWVFRPEPPRRTG